MAAWRAKTKQRNKPDKGRSNTPSKQRHKKAQVEGDDEAGPIPIERIPDALASVIGLVAPNRLDMAFLQEAAVEETEPIVGLSLGA